MNGTGRSWWPTELWVVTGAMLYLWCVPALAWVFQWIRGGLGW